MNINPLERVYDETRRRIAELERQQGLVEEELRWYDSVEPHALTEERERNEATADTLKVQIKALEKKIDDNKASLQELDSAIAAANTARAEIEARIIPLQAAEKRIVDELRWYASIDSRVLMDELTRNEAAAAMQKTQIAVLDKEIESSTIELRALKHAKGTLFNPFNWFAREQVALRRKHAQLRERVTQTMAQRQSCEDTLNDTLTRSANISTELRRYQAFDLPKARAEEQQLKEGIARAKDDLSTLTVRLREHEEKRAGQREIDNQTFSQKQSHANALREIVTRNTKIGIDLKRHSAIDYPRRKNDNEHLKESVARAKNDLTGIAERKKRVDDELAPLLQEMQNMASKKSGAAADLDAAQDLDQRLTAADTAYDRAMIHGECERRFGVGSPRRIVAERQRIVRQLERDYEKAKRRVDDIAAKASRRIDTIVVDGNNLCYEGDGTFIGLAAIERLLPCLSRQYTVIVVFDSAIRRMLKTDDSGLQHRLGSNAKVHVVASRQMADETILDLACDSDSSFVLSNDRYGDFNDKSVVRDGRVIRHEIVNGNVFVHDLQVRLTYT